MMHGPEKSDSAIVATKPANKAEPSVERSAGEPHAAEPVERRAGTEGNVGQSSTRWTQRRISVSQGVGSHTALSAVDTRGGRSYGAGGGGHGTFIVHTN